VILSFRTILVLTYRITATPDGRGLVAIGCAEGVWIGFRHDSRCMCFYCFRHAFYSLEAFFSDATSAASTNGLSMCHARRFRYLPRARRQGMEWIILVYWYFANGPHSRFLPTISKHLCRRHLEQQTLHKRLKSSAGTRTCSSLPLATSAAGLWLSI